jgi:hypothetical protein
MAAVFALVGKVFRDLRLLGQEVAFGVSRNLSVHAFRVATFTAQNPFWIGSHFAIVTLGYAVENRADTLPASKTRSDFGFACVQFLPDFRFLATFATTLFDFAVGSKSYRTKGKDHELHATHKLSVVRIVSERYL